MSRETLPSRGPSVRCSSRDESIEGPSSDAAPSSGPSSDAAPSSGPAVARADGAKQPPENTLPVNPRQTTAPISGTTLSARSSSATDSGALPKVALSKFTSQPSLPAPHPPTLTAPSSIRPSATTVPPRAGAQRKEELGWLASTFWGGLALAFGASAAAVYWELAEEPSHRATELASTSIAAAPSWANMSPMERRRHERLTEWLPVRLESGEAGLAVTHNVSETGALLVTAQELTLGQQVRITVPVPAGSSAQAGSRELELSARVVRVAENEEDPEGLWPYSVAVEFSEPSPALEAVLRTLAH
jgi:hypothetical protein